MVEWFERQKIGRIMFFSRPILFRWALEHLPTPKNRATSLEKTRIGKASGCPATLVRRLWIVRFLKKSAGCRPRIGRSSPDYRPIWHFWVQKVVGRTSLDVCDRKKDDRTDSRRDHRTRVARHRGSVGRTTVDRIPIVVRSSTDFYKHQTIGRSSQVRNLDSIENRPSIARLSNDIFCKKL